MTQAPAATGPKVFLDYDQDALDAAYDQNVYAPNREQIDKRNNANSAAVRARIGEPERIAYGTRPEEHLDVFRTKKPNAPIFVFVRGGAWRATGIERYAFVAEPSVQAGVHCVIPQYAGVENVDGKLMTLAGQVRSAVAWVYRNAARIGGDPAKLYVGGHSSGAHMAGVVAITGWERFGLPPDAVKGVLCSSGMYELYPVSLSKRSSYVAFDEATIDALSAQRHIDRIRMPFVVSHGTFETPEFQRQAREFAAALQAAGKPVKLVVGEGFNHFEIIETLGNPYGLLGHVALEFLGLPVTA
jgi:arylformamidase